MAVKLRLKRMGTKKKPFYRIVAADSRFPRDGRFIEEVGYYNPLVTPADVKIDEEKVMKWLTTGAIPTDTVRDLFSKSGIMKKLHESKQKKSEKPVKEAKKSATTKTVKKEVKKEVKKTTANKATAAKKTTTKKTTKKEA